jgi:DHA2 family multidrug resistance protein
VVIQPLWLQTNLGYTATWAGYAVAPSGVFAIVMSPIVAKMMGKIDSRLLIFIGVMGLAGTMAWRGHFASNITFVQIIVPQLAQGIFVPFFFVPLFSLALATLKPADLAGGAGVMAFARTMAGAFATSVSTTVWANGARTGRVHLLDQLDTGRAVQTLTHAGLSQGQALRQFEAMVQGQAVMLATDKLFMTLAVLMAVAACSIWFTAKPTGRVAAPAGH